MEIMLFLAVRLDMWTICTVWILVAQIVANDTKELFVEQRLFAVVERK